MKSFAVMLFHTRWIVAASMCVVATCLATGSFTFQSSTPEPAVVYAPMLSERPALPSIFPAAAKSCEHDCCLHGHAVNVPCAMYAPGYRPRHDNEDTPSSTQPVEFKTAGPGVKWPQPGGKGTTVTITYSYSNLLDGGMDGITVPQLKSAVEEALGLWATYAPLDFQEVADSGPDVSDTSYSAAGTPNLRFGHHSFDGALGVLAHAYYPQNTSTAGLSGDLHFDDGENWSTAPGSNVIDFLEVCTHEIGHTLGLNHQNPPRQAIMNPTYGARFDGLGTAFLFNDDIRGIQYIYGKSSGSRQLGDKLIAGDFAGLLPTKVQKLIGR